jgi:hypothetical protein
MMYVSGILFAYVVLVIVCAACLVAICWSVHSLFYRDHFASPLPMRAPQLSYMRDVRQRELQSLVASNDVTTGADEKNFHDDFVEECTCPNSSIKSIDGMFELP